MNEDQGAVSKEKLLDELSAVIAETESVLKSLASAGTEKANAAADATEEFVKDNPWRAIGIAAVAGALAGLVAGLMISRR